MNVNDNLHPAMTQDAVEFFMTFVVPLPGQNLKTLKDLLEDIELPQWLLPIVHVSHFLHYFKGDLQSLPSDSIKLDSPSSLNSIVTLDLKDMPEGYSKEWLRQAVIKCVKKNEARVLAPSTDLVFY